MTGLLSIPPGTHRLAVLLHGLGGSSDSLYLRALAAAAESQGFASLRLNLRGANGEASDLYHAGLTEDLRVALANSMFDRFDQLTIAGLSLGGHVALRYATETTDPRLVAVAAVCAPLDLSAAADAIDRPSMWAYRAYLLRGLRRHAERVWRAGHLTVSPSGLARVRTLREWDSLTVAPRFGFTDAADYYSRAGVAPRLDRLVCPALELASKNDPMVPPTAIHPARERHGEDSTLRVCWLSRGGHLGFPRQVDLGGGLKGEFSLQIMRWLARHCEASG